MKPCTGIVMVVMRASRATAFLAPDRQTFGWGRLLWLQRTRCRCGAGRLV